MTDQLTRHAATAAPPVEGAFAMQIEDVFHLPHGRTTFTGYVSGAPVSLRGRVCDLVVDEHVVQTLELEGEMIPRRIDPSITEARRLRSVSTIAEVRLDAETARSRRCRLVDHVVV